MHQRCMLYTCLAQTCTPSCKLALQAASLNLHPMNTLSFLFASAAASVALFLPVANAGAVQLPQVERAAAKKKMAAAASKPPQVAAAADDGAPEFINFLQWRSVAEFVDQASAEHGFDRDELQSLFRRAQYLDSVVRLINPPPAGKAKNWTAYRERFVEPRRIKAGMVFWDRHESALRRAEEAFGVPAEIIVGIIGVETVYGQSTGNFRVPDVLATLGFAYPDTPNRDARMAYFRGELMQALLYARENDIDPFSLSGSYAGAIGWPQFMPGSIRNFAVDFDRDGKIDLRNSPEDAIGSVASFLTRHGWTTGLPLAFPVQVTPGKPWPTLIGQGLEAKFSRAQIVEAGVIVPQQVPDAIIYGLVDLEDNGRPVQYWLGTNNFFAITRYNRSYYYAMAVIELGQAISRQRGVK